MWEALTGIRIIKFYNDEDYESEKYGTANDKNYNNKKLIDLVNPILIVLMNDLMIIIILVEDVLINKMKFMMLKIAFSFIHFI